MEEKLGKLDYVILAIISVIILLVIIVFFYVGCQKINEQRYEGTISGEIIEIKPSESINPAGYVIDPAIGVALAQPSKIVVKTTKETLEIEVLGQEITNNDMGKKAIIKEKGVMREGKKIREELILVSIE